MGSRLEKKSKEVLKRINNHAFDNETGEEYESSKFGGFSEYFRRKKIKLQNLDAELREHSKDKPQIFRGIVAHINGYTQPSLNDLHELIVSHGGGFIQYLDGKTMVTHIIASSLTPKKAVEFKRYRIVKPAWIVDSVKAGRLLPWNEYRVVDEGVTQKVLGFQGGQVVSKVNTKTRGYRDQTDTSWYTSQLHAQKEGSPISTAPPAVPDGVDDAPSHSTPAATSSFDQSDLEKLDKVVIDAEAKDADPGTPEGRAVEDGPHGQTEYSAPTLQTPPPSAGASVIPVDESPASNLKPIEVAVDDVDLSERQQAPSLKRQRTPTEESTRKAARLTAEEHNAILLADPRIRKSTVVNPDFLEQYYRESRLHHLSTWKADLKSQLRVLTEAKSSSQKARQKRPAGARRYIMHVDFDSFFVAVSLKKYPQYKDKPCVVAHGGGSGSEIASCNYPAREYGISNGMWMKRAQELCKDLEVLPYDFPAYEEASRRFYDAILATDGIVQSVSIDEALVDISMICIAAGGTDGVRRNEGGAYREQSEADEIATALRAKVVELTGCNVSVGIGGNILLAKIALRKAKPAGQYHLKPESVLDFIGELEVQSLPGVAYSLGGKLEEMGIRYVKDIRQSTKEQLVTKLGPKTGEKLWDYSRGIDRVEVGDVVLRKSVSAEVNWGVRFENQEQVEDFIENLCTELEKRLLKEKVKGKQLTLKIMRRSADAPLDPPKHLGHGKCDTYNKSVQLGVYTNDAKVINKETLAILRGFGFSPGELRGIGVQMQKLESIKSDGAAEGSQRRLQFKLPANTLADVSPARGAVQEKQNTESIEEVVTPKMDRLKDMATSALPMQLLADSPSKKTLNVAGTQFVLPTQVDPAILAELPEDIRARLTRHIMQPRQQPENSDTDEPTDGEPMSRAGSPVLGLPNESQLDAETLAALPPDVRAEVLASYKRSAPRPKNQVVLPQSPRKNRQVPPSKMVSARGRRGRSGLFGTRSRTAGNDNTLTQSNFVARPISRSAAGAHDANDSGAESEPGPAAAELDPDFLAALPPELRQEVIDNHRRERLRRTGGIDLSMHQRPRASKRAPGKAGQQEVVERLFRLAPRAPKPTFTSSKLSELADLRGMIRDWVREFWDDDPFVEDVDAIITYLRAVVLEERDLDKAVRIVKWFDWVVDEDAGTRWQGDEMRARWSKVVEKVRLGVGEAVRERGLAPVDFS